ncbi:MAG: gliding motility-associated C-terminal domain-containing protein [Saprospiraceae bacterium]
MRTCLLFLAIVCCSILSAQVYVVNSFNDLDDGVCDGVHCSLREAINAAEADGVPSTIRFNIPGAGPHSINPGASFGKLIQDDLTILGESQPGGPGSIIIDFNFRNFGAAPFWLIRGKRFYMSGIDFTDFYYDMGNSTLLAFGEPPFNPSDSRIYNCAFLTDNSPTLGTFSKSLIFVFGADNLSISNCYFGTDRTLSTINSLEGSIIIDQAQKNGKVNIDSNIFVNKFIPIYSSAGILSINKNIFGALDTSKSANFLDPISAIFCRKQDFETKIEDNFFYGYQGFAIGITSNNVLKIRKNRFYNNILDIGINGLVTDTNYITDNYARNGKVFLNTMGMHELYMERNNVSNYDTVLYHQNSLINQKIRYIDNWMNCINVKAIIMDPTNIPSHAIPTISSVNKDQVVGTGNPNDSVIVYYNNHISCANTICEAGIELGRTKADGAGNWILKAAYPNKSTISAYQYDSNPNQRPTLYSEFSNCYQCAGQVKTNFAPSICKGQNVTYRGKQYSETNLVDSFVVKGDAVSICDSVFLVNVSVNSDYRSHLDVSVCYQDTLRFGNLKIYKNHLSDSLKLNSVFGCDSTITITGQEVGVASFNQTICDNASVTIFGTLFDKNKTSGTAIGTGQAVAGCDSVVFVNLKINNFTESFLNRNLCTGQSITIGTELFDQSRLTGDAKLPGGSSTGCDSIIHVSLSYPNTTGNFSTNLCIGDSIKVANKYFSNKNPTGQDTIKGGSRLGCDSLINVTIVSYPVATGSFTASICKGDSIRVINKYFSETNPNGQDILKGGSRFGCDSFINVSISIHPVAIGNFTAKYCAGDSIKVINKYFSDANPNGQDTLKGGSHFGCDSLINVSLTRYPIATGNFTTNLCPGDSIKVGNKYYSDRNPIGQEILKSASQFACDSFINVSINVLPIARGTYTASFCKNDTVYLGTKKQAFYLGNQTGSFIESKSSANGCDSIVDVQLSILPDAIGNFDSTLCENKTRTLYGQTFSLQNPSGRIIIPNASSRLCDSILNVNLTFVSETSGSFTPIICRTGSVQVNGQVFNAGRPSGMVRIIGGSSSGCDSVVNVSLSFNPSILLDFDASDLKCNKASTGELVLTNVLGGSGNFKVSIDNGPLMNYNQGLTIGNLAKGNHSIRISDQLACDSLFNFTINNSQVLTLHLPNDTTINQGATVDIITNLNFSATNIVWDPTTYLSCIDCLNPLSSPDHSTTYILTATDENGCTASDKIAITVLIDETEIFIPTAFSPNGDNLNDIFTPVFKFQDRTAIKVFQIFDRWGNLLFEQKDAAKGQAIGWNGMSRNRILNPGVYVYLIQFVGDDNIEKRVTGDITLLR